MSKQWQIRRGTAAENDSFTGAEGEVTMDTTHKSVRIHDGSTQGGITVSTMVAPSNTYDNLTLGASGDDYLAPANGYFTIAKSTSGSQWVVMQNNSNGMQIQSSTNGSGICRAFMPAQKGQYVKVEYNASGTTNIFRFVYAEDSK